MLNGGGSLSPRSGPFTPTKEPWHPIYFVSKMLQVLALKGHNLALYSNIKNVLNIKLQSIVFVVDGVLCSSALPNTVGRHTLKSDLMDSAFKKCVNELIIIINYIYAGYLQSLV